MKLLYILFFALLFGCSENPSTTKAKVTDRIIGGRLTGGTPSVKITLPGGSRCSASFLGNHILLTAGHCVKSNLGLKPSLLKPNDLLLVTVSKVLPGIKYEYPVRQFKVDRIWHSNDINVLDYNDGFISENQLVNHSDWAFISIKLGENLVDYQTSMQFVMENVSRLNLNTIVFSAPKMGDTFYVDGWGFPNEDDGQFAKCTINSGVKACRPTVNFLDPEDDKEVENDNMVKRANFTISQLSIPNLSINGQKQMFVSESNFTEYPANPQTNPPSSYLMFPWQGRFQENGMLIMGDSGAAAIAVLPPGAGTEVKGVFSGFEYTIGDRPAHRWWNIFSTVDNVTFKNEVQPGVIVNILPTSVSRKAFIAYGKLIHRAVQREPVTDAFPTVQAISCNSVSSAVHDEYEWLKARGATEGEDYTCLYLGGGKIGQTAKNFVVSTKVGGKTVKTVYPITLK